MSSNIHPAYAHQFDDLEHQHEASNFGMWVFIATEIMFFGGLFTGYTMYRGEYFSAFRAGSHELDLTLGAINTAVLIGSSLTMALSIHSVQTGKKKLGILFLILTMLLGLGFLGIKGVEYAQKFEHHLVPGYDFHPEGIFPQHMQLFFSFYFALTGLHALHMIIGVGILTVLLIATIKGRFSPQHFAPLEVAGLYWHFVDVIWIFLFPLLYLIGGR